MKPEHQKASNSCHFFSNFKKHIHTVVFSLSPPPFTFILFPPFSSFFAFCCLLHKKNIPPPWTSPHLWNRLAKIKSKDRIKSGGRVVVTLMMNSLLY